MRLTRVFHLFLTVLAAAFPDTCRTLAHPQDLRHQAVALVEQVQRADYEGDRAALRALHGKLAGLQTPALDAALQSRLRYWRGFALWRLAFNSFNDKVEPNEIGSALEAALDEFDAALEHDQAFIDAATGSISCAQALAAINRDDPEKVKAIVSRFVPMLKDALARAPDHPRLLWVWGAQQWYQKDQAGAFATYERALQVVRRDRERAPDPLEPAWGEPELLMSLAWANLNRSPPDRAAAERHAAAALALVPHWRYLRDILIPQIRKAPAGATARSR
jgi:hypothetical protein